MKAHHTILFLLPLMLLLPGCSSASHDDSPRALGEDQIRAAVIGYELANPPHVGETPTKVIFVSLGHATENANPSEALVKQFPTGVVPVEPYSACDFQPLGVIDHRTGARGILLQLGEIRWENDDRASVNATTWIAKGLGAVNVYHLAKEQGHWIVKERQSMGAA